jgi:hypothetical protein
MTYQLVRSAREDREKVKKKPLPRIDFAQPKIKLQAADPLIVARRDPAGPDNSSFS